MHITTATTKKNKINQTKNIKIQTNKQTQKTNKCKQIQTNANKYKQMQTNANKCKQMQTNKSKCKNKQQNKDKQIGQQKRTGQTNQPTNQPMHQSASLDRSKTLSNFHRKTPLGCAYKPIKLKGGFGGFTAWIIYFFLLKFSRLYRYPDYSLFYIKSRKKK